MNNDLNDLVKRGAVCDMLHEEMGAWGNCADEIEALLKANDALFKIPAVDAVEVVHGRWVPIKVPNQWDKGKCSACSCVFTSSVWGTAYCPNCGARMDGEQNVHSK